MDKLYENIKKRRQELGLTQMELAKKLGYTNRASISKVEAGVVDLSQSRIIQFAKALDTTPGELMGETGFPDVPTDGQSPQYYEDEVVQAVTDRLRTNPEYGVMFKAASNVRPEEVDFVTKFIEKLSD